MKKINDQAVRGSLLLRAAIGLWAGASVIGGLAPQAQADVPDSSGLPTTLPQAHNGGHCQFAFDHKPGKNWIVFYTIVRNCRPAQTGPIEFESTLPTPATQLPTHTSF